MFNLQKFDFYENIFFIQGGISLFRYFLFYLLLSVCLGIFAYCVPSLHSNLSSEGVRDKSGGGGDDDDYDEGEDEEDCEENEDEEDCEEEDEDEDEEIDEMDMPYDIRVDTASFLTCDARKLPDDVFAFKFSALEGGTAGGGVRLRQAFGKKDKSEIKRYPYYKSYPALIPIPKRWSISPSNNIRNSNYPSQKLSLPSIELEEYLDDFLEKGANFTHEFGRERLQLGWEANLNLRYSLHHLFKNNHLLLSFYQPGRGNSLLGYRDLENRKETTHGRYYRIDVEREKQYYILTDITERYPIHKKVGETEYEWDCHSPYEVRRHDNHRYLGEGSPEEPGCEDDDDGSEAYELIQQVLGEDWNINTRERCVSLKSHRNSCYRYTHSPHQASRRTNQGKGRVEFSDSCENHIARLCPHYFSFCTR